MVSSRRLSSWLLPFACLLSVAVSASFDGSTLSRRSPPSCTTTLAMPTPSGYVCGVQGMVERPSVIAKTTAASQVACRNTCLNNSSCISFSYGPSKTCTTYSAKIVKSEFKRGQTGKTFWNHHCYKTTCTCPQGLTDCSGNCVDLMSNDMCGSCTNACTNGTTCLGGFCACGHGPLGTSLNCGTCGNMCPSDQACSGNTCVCDPSQTFCTANCGPLQCTQSFGGVYHICTVINDVLVCLSSDGTLDAYGGSGALPFYQTDGQWSDGNGNYLYMMDDVEGGTVTLDPGSSTTGVKIQCTIPSSFANQAITCYNILGQALVWYLSPSTDNNLHLGIAVPPGSVPAEVTVR